ncbi:hypothetical protein PLICRDRAFT_592671 [Plicaturopsis crispa FD-325 SS-3]|nr:hypothetical protein PLICRDRAFT_592671 [Plicaturopsis crispa FD-325 SS-3]
MFPKKRQLPQCRQGCFEEDGVTPILKKLCAHSSSGRKRQAWHPSRLLRMLVQCHRALHRPRHALPRRPHPQW